MGRDPPGLRRCLPAAGFARPRWDPVSVALADWPGLGRGGCGCRVGVGLVGDGLCRWHWWTSDLRRAGGAPRAFRLLRRLLSPLSVGAAWRRPPLGLGLLIAPFGLDPRRALSPWATAVDRPPDRADRERSLGPGVCTAWSGDSRRCRSCCLMVLACLWPQVRAGRAPCG